MAGLQSSTIFRVGWCWNIVEILAKKAGISFLIEVNTDCCCKQKLLFICLHQTIFCEWMKLGMVTEKDHSVIHSFLHGDVDE